MRQEELIANWEEARIGERLLASRTFTVMRKITQLDLLEGRRLRLHYGPEAVEVDFAPLAQRGGVYAPLAERFEQAAIGPQGRFVTWPGELDFCADALWLEAHSEVSR